MGGHVTNTVSRSICQHIYLLCWHLGDCTSLTGALCLEHDVHRSIHTSCFGSMPVMGGSQDEERMKKAVNLVPTHKELNAMLARTPAEEALFDRLDAELQWPQIPLGKVTLDCGLLVSAFSMRLHYCCSRHGTCAL